MTEEPKKRRVPAPRKSGDSARKPVAPRRAPKRGGRSEGAAEAPLARPAAAQPRPKPRPTAARPAQPGEKPPQQRPAAKKKVARRAAPAQPRPAAAQPRPAAAQPRQTEQPKPAASAKPRVSKPAVGGKRPAVASKPAVAGGRPAARPKVGGQRPAARPAAGRPAAGRPAIGGKRPAGKPAAAGRRPVRQRPAVAAGGDGDDFEEDVPFQVRKKSSVPLFVGIGVVVVVGVVIGVMAMSDDSGTQDKVAKVEPKVEAPKGPDPRQVRAQKRLDLAKKFWVDNPKNYGEARNELYNVRIVAAKFPEIVEEARLLEEKITGLHRESALREWGIIKAQVEADFKSGTGFEKAVERLENMPPVLMSFADDALQAEVQELYRHAEMQFVAYRRFSELRSKAVHFMAVEKLDKVALKILDMFDDGWESDAPDVWALCVAKKLTFERDGIAAVAAEQRILEQERLAKVERKRKERLALAEKRWLALRNEIEWVNHLGRHNLYNWRINTDSYTFDKTRWTLRREGDIGVMVGDNNTGHEMYIGPYTKHWQDYVVEFEVKLVEGTLELSPRTSGTVLGVGRPKTIVDSEKIIFGDSYKGKWVKITMEVHGEVVELTRHDTNKKTVYNGEGSSDSLRLLDTGGFLFFLPENSKVQIKNVRVKLVTSTRSDVFK